MLFLFLSSLVAALMGLCEAQGPITTNTVHISANYNISSTDATVFLNASQGGFNVFLPPAAALEGRVIMIQDEEGSVWQEANYVFIYCAGEDDIGGHGTVVLIGNSFYGIQFRSTGKNRWVSNQIAY